MTRWVLAAGLVLVPLILVAQSVREPLYKVPDPLSLEAITVDAMDAGAVRAGVIQADSVDAGVASIGYLTVGALDAGTARVGSAVINNLDAGSARVGSLTAGDVDAGTLRAGTGSAGTWTVNTLDAGVAGIGFVTAGGADAGTARIGSLVASDVDAGTLSVGSLTAGNVDAGTLFVSLGSATSWTVGTLDAGTLRAGSIVSGDIDAGVVTATALRSPSVGNGDGGFLAFTGAGVGLAVAASVGTCNQASAGKISFIAVDVYDGGYEFLPFLCDGVWERPFFEPTVVAFTTEAGGGGLTAGDSMAAINPGQGGAEVWYGFFDAHNAGTGGGTYRIAVVQNGVTLCQSPVINCTATGVVWDGDPRPGTGNGPCADNHMMARPAGGGTVHLAEVVFVAGAPGCSNYPKGHGTVTVRRIHSHGLP